MASQKWSSGLCRCVVSQTSSHSEKEVQISASDLLVPPVVLCVKVLTMGNVIVEEVEATTVLADPVALALETSGVELGAPVVVVSRVKNGV